MSSLSMAGAAPPCPDIRTEVVAKKTMRLNPRSNAEILLVLMLAALSRLPDSEGMDGYSTTDDRTHLGGLASQHNARVLRKNSIPSRF